MGFDRALAWTMTVVTVVTTHERAVGVLLSDR
jgi:hypothetical protein